jgi:hypothetical protein
MADRRHRQMATAMAVKMTTIRVIKKARTTRARVTRAMTETSLKEDGEDRHINQ